MSLPISDDARLSREPVDFSLVLGGPLYQLWRRTRLAGDALQLLHRRVIVLALLAWVPLLLLSIAEGHAWGGSVTLPFLHDVEMHVRLLLALPLLILAELVVHQRMRPVVGQFLERGLIPDAARATVRRGHRLGDAPAQFGHGGGAADRVRLRRRRGVHLADAGGARRRRAGTACRSDGRLQPSLAGWWLGCVSLPLFQFLLLRWYFRLFIWARFLWQVSRIELRLMPTHPDRCGGLGFLAAVSYAFAPVLLGPGRGARRDDGQPDLLRGREAARIQAGTHRAGGRDGVRHPRAAAGVQLRNSQRPSARACASTARWRSATCASSTTSGCAAARRRTSR